MTDLDSLTPTPDERVMAALSHVAVLLPMIGIVAPIFIWVTQKDKSRYVAFQALQAVAFQLVMIASWFIGMGCYVLSFFAMVIPISLSSGGTQPGVSPFETLVVFIPFLVFGAIFLVGFFFIVYGVIGAVMAFQGKPFRYFLIGRSVERFLQPKQDEIGAT